MRTGSRRDVVRFLLQPISFRFVSLTLSSLLHLPANNSQNSNIPQDIPDLEPSPPAHHSELPSGDLPSLGDLSLQGSFRSSRSCPSESA